MTIFPVFYFGNIHYFSELIQNQDVNFEFCENYQKQTYRNRCFILGPNGRQRLVIPTRHLGVREYSEIKISYASSWQKEHYRSLEAAYRSSPYFEFYEDEFIKLFENQTEKLFDFNLAAFKLCLSILKLEIPISLTKQYNPLQQPIDYRKIFISKPEKLEGFKKYEQVFMDRYKFEPNLSILDLIFNLGPNSVRYLKEYQH